MKSIHINREEGIRVILFPDHQPHVMLKDIAEGDEVQVTCSLTDCSILIQLLQTANALDHVSAIKKQLVIPWLMAARYDRIMQAGDSFDLEVIASLVNLCGFEKVLLFDVHSEVATQKIKNSFNIKNRQMVEAYQQPQAVLICPDAGASKKINEYAGWNSNLADIIYCAKKRDLATGRISLTVSEPEKCRGRNCVIIDDICDGGATFLAIADQIQPKHLTLLVTHGIFSKGFTALEEKFDEILVSDSFSSNYPSAKVQLIHAIING